MNTKTNACFAFASALLLPASAISQIADLSVQNFAEAGTYVPTVNNFDKKQVVLLYQHYLYPTGYFDASGNYQVNRNFPVQTTYTSDVPNCIAGNISDEFRQAGLRQASFMRAMAGLSSFKVAAADANDKAQAAALSSAANEALNHFPASSSKCFSTKAYDGARQSNLSFGYGNSTPTGLAGYMSEAGDSNYAVGHRRYLLWPALSSMGYGAVSYRSALYSGAVAGADAWFIPQIDATITRNSPEFTAWPSPGYFPSLLLPANSNRWSFSCVGCNFAQSTVEIRSGLQLLPPPGLEPIAGGYADPTFVFKPSGIVPIISADQQNLLQIAADYPYTVSVKNVTLPSGAKKDFSYPVILYDQQKAAQSMVLPKYNINDMWWAGSQENGWGISLTQGVSGAMFGTWYYYLPDGTPTWSIVIGNWESATRFSADVYATTGTSYAQASYDPAQFKVSPSLGKVSVDFSSASTATMNYTVSGSVGTKSISRLVFGGPKFTDGSNYTSQWWAGQAENGWGLSINQQFRTMFAVVYVYDAAGKPTWFTLSGEHAGDGSVVSNKIYAFNGSPLLGVPYDASRLVSREVGTAELKFGGDNNGTLTYTLNGVLVVKQISRLMF